MVINKTLCVLFCHRPEEVHNQLTFEISKLFGFCLCRLSLFLKFSEWILLDYNGKNYGHSVKSIEFLLSKRYFFSYFIFNRGVVKTVISKQFIV